MIKYTAENIINIFKNFLGDRVVEAILSSGDTLPSVFMLYIKKDWMEHFPVNDFEKNILNRYYFDLYKKGEVVFDN